MPGFFDFVVDLVQRRQRAVEIFVDHGAAHRHAVGKGAQQILPVRQARIGDGAHQHPVVGGVDRQHLGDQFLGAAWIRAQHAGDEADIGARGFGVLERLQRAERANDGGKAVRIGLVAIGVDPSQDTFGRVERCARRPRCSRRRHECERDSEHGEQTSDGAMQIPVTMSPPAEKVGGACLAISERVGIPWRGN